MMIRLLGDWPRHADNISHQFCIHAHGAALGAYLNLRSGEGDEFVAIIF